jgi:hypothetical protein
MPMAASAAASFWSTPRRTDDQFESAVTALSDGRFVVTWSDNSQSGGDTSGDAIRGQIFNADGSKRGGEFLVNTTTDNDQYGSAVTALSDGRFVVTWSDFSQSGGDTSGMPYAGRSSMPMAARAAASFWSTPRRPAISTISAVTALSDGRFVVTWMDLARPAATHRALPYAGRSSMPMAASAAASFWSTPRRQRQYDSAVTGLSDGRFVVTWTDGARAAATSGSAIRGQIFNADGTTSGLLLTGTAGSDSLRGAELGDTISGLAGNDSLAGFDRRQRQPRRRGGR